MSDWYVRGKTRKVVGRQIRVYLFKKTVYLVSRSDVRNSLFLLVHH
jgi:hypothetical protein